MQILPTQFKPSKKQTEILILLYRFRFLNRHQIQTILSHKYRSRVLSWLNELVEQKYITAYYDKKLAALPTVYCLDNEGRKYLKSLDKEIEAGNIDPELLNRVWREKKFTKQFREHCLFVADIYINLVDTAKEWKSELQFRTKVDLYNIEGMIKPGPDIYFSLKYPEGEVKRYLLDIFDDIPPVAIRKRVKDYLEYYDSDEWQDNTDKPFPEIIFICPNKRIKGHLYYLILKKRWDGTEPEFYLAIREIVKVKGLNSKVLEKVEERE